VHLRAWSIGGTDRRTALWFFRGLGMPKTNSQLAVAYLVQSAGNSALVRSLSISGVFPRRSSVKILQHLGTLRFAILLKQTQSRLAPPPPTARNAVRTCARGQHRTRRAIPVQQNLDRFGSEVGFHAARAFRISEKTTYTTPTSSTPSPGKSELEVVLRTAAFQAALCASLQRSKRLCGTLHLPGLTRAP
jgi:hypothetical protein